MRKICYLILILPLFSIAQKLEGQKLIDSLLVELPKMKEDTLKVNLLNDIADKYESINDKQKLNFAIKALSLATKINYKNGIFYANSRLCQYYISIADYKKSEIFSKKLLNTATNKYQLFEAYKNLFIFHGIQSNPTKSLEYCNKALVISIEIKDQIKEALVYNSIANVHSKMNNYKKAIFFQEKAIAIYEIKKNESSLAQSYHNLAVAFSNIGEMKKANETFSRAISLCEGSKYSLIKAACLNSLGLNYFDQQKYINAIKFCSESLKINQSIKNEFGLSNNYGALGAIYATQASDSNNNKTKKELYSKAEANFNEALKIEKKFKNKEEIFRALYNISGIQEENGAYKNALSTRDLANIYKDSIFNSENKETIKNLEDKREIELRDNQLKINKLSLEAKEKQKWLYVAGIGFLIFIGGLLFYQSQKRKQTNNKLEILNKNLDQNNLKLETLNKDLDQANQAKTRFFGILNHDLRGPVNNLVIFLQLQQEAPEMLDAEKTKRMQDKTMTGAKNLLASMEDILQWSKSQMENFKPQPKNVLVQQLFDDTKKVFSGYLNIKIEYNNPDNIEIFTDDNYLKTIVRNLTSNAINIFKTTQNPMIIWKAWQVKNTVYLSITDNGDGADKDQFKALYDDKEVVGIKTGLGLHLIRDLAKAINCEISVESTIGKGTTFILKL